MLSQIAAFRYSSLIQIEYCGGLQSLAVAEASIASSATSA